EHRRVGRAGRDRQHADTVARKLSRNRQRQADDAALRGRVGRLTDLAVVGGVRRGVDDHPALPVRRRLVGRHRRRGEPDHVERADEVDLDDALEGLERERLPVLADDEPRAADAGAVDDAVQGAEVVDSGLDRAPDARLVEHVRLDDAAALTGLQVGDEHVRPPTSEEGGSGGAEPGPAARDEERPPRDVHYVETGASANCSRSAVLRILPTPVFGSSATNSMRSGSHHFAKWGARKSRSSSAVAVCPSRTTTTASGRSCHLSSGIAITAASASAGCAISWFSSATDEIHSPPDLITSFARSWIWMKPRGSIVTMSPVLNQPSLVQRSAASGVSW